MDDDLLKYTPPKEPDRPIDFTISNNYIITPTINLENINELLLRFYKEKGIVIKLRLHSKSEYEFSGKIIYMYGREEQDREKEEEDKKDEEELKKVLPKDNVLDTNVNSVGYIPITKYPFHYWYIILKDDKDNKIKLFLADIDHRTIMPKSVQAVKPLFSFEREQVSQKLRYEILNRDSYTCQYCGRKPPEVTLEVDHIMPSSKGGVTEKHNLITSCRDCNIGKSDKIIGVE